MPSGKGKRYNARATRQQTAYWRQHDMMSRWFTKLEARREEERAGSDRYIYIGSEPAPVAHFIPLSHRYSAPYCNGRHVDGECPE